MSKAEAGVGNALAKKANDAADPKIFCRTARRSAFEVLPAGWCVKAFVFVLGDEGTNARPDGASQQEVHSIRRRAGLAAKIFMAVMLFL